MRNNVGQFLTKRAFVSPRLEAIVDADTGEPCAEGFASAMDRAQSIHRGGPVQANGRALVARGLLVQIIQAGDVIQAIQ